MNCFKVVLVLASVILASCQSAGNLVHGQGTAKKVLEANEGTILFGYTLDNQTCDASVYVSGRDTNNQWVQKTLSIGTLHSLSGRKDVVVTMPAGNYGIDGIYCYEAYLLGSSTSGSEESEHLKKIAYFKVGAGQIRNLGMLEIKRTTPKKLWETGPFQTISNVRQFTDKELVPFRNRNPDLVSKMIYDPMQI